LKSGASRPGGWLSLRAYWGGWSGLLVAGLRK